jgi:hypothetical protein
MAKIPESSFYRLSFFIFWKTIRQIAKFRQRKKKKKNTWFKGANRVLGFAFPMKSCILP